MAPKRSRTSGAASQSAPPRFLSRVTQKQHAIVGEKGLVQEIGIEILSRRENCPSVMTLVMTQSRHRNFLLKRETSIKPLKDGKEWSSQPYPSSGVGYARGRY